jgi:polyhydroxyalkanoate synthesis regulator phasin
MAVVMKQFIDRFKAMEKIANETLAANPEALVGVDSLPGSEHDVKVPEDAKKPDKEVAQGQPAGATSAAGAVAGGDAKPLEEGKLEMDEPLLNPEKKPLITDDALTAKVANDHLTSLVKDLLADINGTQKQASKVEQKSKITLDDDTISKLAAAQATFQLGREAADKAIKQASAQNAAVAQARKLVKAACVKAAQEAGLDPATAEVAANNALEASGVPEASSIPTDVAAASEAAPEAAPEALAEATPEEAAAQIPDDVTEEELATAIVDLVSSGELDPDTAKALVEEIAADDGATAEGSSEDEAAQIIADGLQSGEITPEQAQEIATAIESGETAGDADEAAGAADAAAAVQDAQDEAQGAADAEAAIQDASDEAQGSADAEEAMKTAAAMSAPKSTRIMGKVASILQKKAEAAKAASAKDASYIAGFKKKAAAMGVDPSALARYMLAKQSAK